ncbi:MAG: MerR family transcriptional regulator [Capsulimonadaceae bacterium]
MPYVKDRNQPIYTISVAARLVRPAANVAEAKPIHAQTLRMYDRLGLVKPQKVGKNRFYSDHDIEKLQRIQHFTQDMGINLAGVAYIFALLDHLRQASPSFEGIEAMMHEAEQRVLEWDKLAE